MLHVLLIAVTVVGTHLHLIRFKYSYTFYLLRVNFFTIGTVLLAVCIKTFTRILVELQSTVFSFLWSIVAKKIVLIRACGGI